MAGVSVALTARTLVASALLSSTAEGTSLRNSQPTEAESREDAMTQEAPSQPYVMVSLGDSITSAFNTRLPGNFGNRRYSWSTGKSSGVFSHYQRVRMTTHREVKTLNHAKPGAESPELLEQYERIANTRVDYMTLLIGANDLCAWSDDHTKEIKAFNDTISSVVERSIKNNPNIKIVIPAVPDMPHLYRLGRNRCQFKWDLFSACPRLLGSASNKKRRERFAEQLIDLNATLNSFEHKHPRNVKFIKEVYRTKFSKELISVIDCFHPSIKGQAALAKITWENDWLFR